MFAAAGIFSPRLVQEGRSVVVVDPFSRTGAMRVTDEQIALVRRSYFQRPGRDWDHPIHKSYRVTSSMRRRKCSEALGSLAISVRSSRAWVSVIGSTSGSAQSTLDCRFCDMR